MWISITVRLVTDAGRQFTLNNLRIGIVKTTSPLLILGKKTCAICGYKTIRQQDTDRNDKHESSNNSRVTQANQWAANQARITWQPKENKKQSSNSPLGKQNNSYNNSLEIKTTHPLNSFNSFNAPNHPHINIQTTQPT